VSREFDGTRDEFVGKGTFHAWDRILTIAEIRDFVEDAPSNPPRRTTMKALDILIGVAIVVGVGLALAIPLAIAALIRFLQP
jgi:hypothetical protein